jgi:hypothetical protein
MQIYKKGWCTFGIIDYIYYSKYEGYTIVLKGNSPKSLLDCNVEDFNYRADRIAFQYVMELYNKSFLSQDKYVTYGDID